MTTDTDLAYQSAIKASRTGPFIMCAFTVQLETSYSFRLIINVCLVAVSPWQFKNFGTSDTDWVEQSDTLWNTRWTQAVNTVKPDIIEIATWNDYGESHYIGDINPNVYIGDASNYVNGFDHSPWRVLAKYYISYYKNGTPPAITVSRFWPFSLELCLNFSPFSL